MRQRENLQPGHVATLGVVGFEMKKLKTDWSERKCSACNGTGFPTVKQPARPGRRIYPPPCAKCKGMGRIRMIAK
jgi:DnaJ-class molecular chaperone